jgi:hypothetical protein
LLSFSGLFPPADSAFSLLSSFSSSPPIPAVSPSRIPRTPAQLSSLDPIRTSKLSQSISSSLTAAQTVNGGPEAFMQQWLGKVDPLLVEELGKRLGGELKG